VKIPDPQSPGPSQSLAENEDTKSRGGGSNDPEGDIQMEYSSN
jgi:hypothetical protein